MKKTLIIKVFFFACRKVETHQDPVGAGLLAKNDNAVNLPTPTAKIDIN
ncbi:hypothetical protein ACW9IK_03445 [Pseudomonas gingeri]